MKNIKEITDIFKYEIQKKYTRQISMPIYLGVSDMEIILEEIEQLKSQLQQKENIIKEVREYFKNHTLKYDDLMLIKPSDVLEILDKGIKDV